MAGLDGNPLNSAAAIGVEMEKLRDSVYAQFNQDDTFLSRLPAKTHGDDGSALAVSSRLVRIPMLIQPGATFGQFVPDGTTNSMGTGGGSIYDEGVATPVYFVQSCQVTKQAEWSTNSSSKAITDVFKEEFKTNLRQFRTNLEGLVASSDGSGTLGTITTVTSTTQLTVSNAQGFQAGCTYQVWSALGGTNRGNIQILTVDLINNILYLANAGPAGMAANDLLIVSGANGSLTQTYSPDRYTTATIAASLLGVPGVNLNSSTGNFYGIPRTTYPGVLNPAYINGVSAALSPQNIMLLESLLQRADGVDAEEVDEYVVHANVDQVTQWESLGLFSQTTSGAAVTAFTNKSKAGEGGDERPDFLNKKRIKTLAGHELITNIKAVRTRVDLINFKYWFRVETKPAALYDVDGVTVFPLYGSDGGVAPTSAFYFVTGFQVVANKPRANAYIDSLATPSGY
jgi:hypothetical protein